MPQHACRGPYGSERSPSGWCWACWARAAPSWPYRCWSTSPVNPPHLPSRSRWSSSLRSAASGPPPSCGAGRSPGRACSSSCAGDGGGYGGAHLATYIAGRVQMAIFALVMLLAATLMFRRNASRVQAAERRQPSWKTLLENPPGRSGSGHVDRTRRGGHLCALAKRHRLDLATGLI